ncbi:MAG: FemAB family PEP-CTERM system-associated protein [Nitrospira defluvii]|nr:FemAB family PEP-CTERM system-associated protein [Nitrospira defluvii]
MIVSHLQQDQDQQAWDQYVLSHPGASGYHLTAWRCVIEKAFGHPTVYLLAKDQQGHLRGILPLVLLASRLFGRFLVSLPFVNYGGLLTSDENARKALLDAAIQEANRLAVAHVELRHQDLQELGWLSSQRKVTMRLGLSGRFDDLWKAFPSKLRSQIRRGQKERMEVSFGGSECLEGFYSVFSRCMRDLGTPVYSKRFFTQILAAFPKDARICLVKLQNAPVAAGLLYGFRHSLEIPWAASDKRYNRFAPNMLLYSSILEHACQEGFQVFDFGRSSPDSGTYRFKEQWGAKPHALVWHYWLRGGSALPQLNPQNPQYQLAIRMWQHLPLAVANRLGPHIVKYLP